LLYKIHPWLDFEAPEWIFYLWVVNVGRFSSLLIA
jgi:hypothetical protein